MHDRAVREADRGPAGLLFRRDRPFCRSGFSRDGAAQGIAADAAPGHSHGAELDSVGRHKAGPTGRSVYFFSRSASPAKALKVSFGPLSPPGVASAKYWLSV